MRIFIDVLSGAAKGEDCTISSGSNGGSASCDRTTSACAPTADPRGRGSRPRRPGCAPRRNRVEWRDIRQGGPPMDAVTPKTEHSHHVRPAEMQWQKTRFPG